MKKISLKNIKDGLSRSEMRSIMGGSGCCSGGCTECKQCNWASGNRMCVTMSTCEEARRILNNLC